MSESTRQGSAGPFAMLGQKPQTLPEPPPQASDVGTLLCATRMRLGKDLQDIAAVLHIRYNFLVAIEDGRYEDLPGQAYAMGFVRAYADHLGLAGDEVVRRYKEETAGIKRVTRFEYPVSTPESGIPSGALLMIAVVLGMMVYGVWYSMADADRRATDVIQEVPDRLAAMLNNNSTSTSEPEAAPQSVAASARMDTEAETVPVVSEDDESAPPSLAQPEPEKTPTPPTTVAAVVPPPVIAAPIVPKSAAQQIEALNVSPPVEKKAEPQAPPKVVPPVVQPSTFVASAPMPPPVVTKPQALPAPVQTAVKPSVVTSAPPVVAAPVAAKPTPAPTPAPPPTTVASTTPPATAPAPKAVASTPAPTPSTTQPSAPKAAPSQTASAGRSAVELRAKSDSWIQVRDGEQLLLTRFLRKGESYKVPDRSGLTLMTLNAGGIEIVVDGQLMPSLGDAGSVARGVALDAAKLKAMPKPAAPPPAE